MTPIRRGTAQRLGLRKTQATYVNTMPDLEAVIAGLRLMAKALYSRTAASGIWANASQPRRTPE